MSSVRSHGGMWPDLGLGRVAAIAAILVGAVALQSTVVAQVTLLGVIPQLVLIVVVSLAFTDGPRVGVVTAFAGGLLQDLLLPQSIVGLTALVYVLIAYAVGSFREYSTSDSVWAPVFAVALSSLVAEASYALLSVILGQPWVSFVFTTKVIGLVVLYNTLLTPLLFPLIRRVADRFRPERVYRW
jgi:rod shape-determining protein MreD